MKTATDIVLTVEAEGLNEREIKKALKQFLERRLKSGLHIPLGIGDNVVEVNSCEVKLMSCHVIERFGDKMNYAQAVYTASGYPPDDDGLSIDELIGGNS